MTGEGESPDVSGVRGSPTRVGPGLVPALTLGVALLGAPAGTAAQGAPPPPGGPSDPAEAAGSGTAETEATQEEDAEEPVDAVWLGPGGPRRADAGVSGGEPAEGPGVPSAGPADGDGDRFELVLPPLLLRRGGGVRTTAFFPLFYAHQTRDSRELVVGPYYLRRGEREDVDVLFPIFWNVRGDDRFALVIPPFYLDRGGDDAIHGLAPLYFAGRFGAERYTLIPPLLTFTWRKPDAAFTLAALYWRVRRRDQVRAGFFPLIWHGHDPGGSSDVVFPFYFRFRTEDEDKTVTVVPPVFLRERGDRSDWGVAPLVFHGENDEGDYWTVPPLLFHYERFAEEMKLITPLFGYVEDDDGSTFVSWLYQNHRGDTRLDAVAPLFFWFRDLRDASSTLVVTPLFWHLEDPASYTTVFFPFFARSGTRGVDRFWLTPLAGRYRNEREDTSVTWVFPTFQTRREPDTFIFNAHPLLYVKRSPEQNHVMLPPLFFDIERPEREERRTVAFPVFWRWEDGDEVTQVAGNTYFRRYRERGDLGWEFHFFPLFAFGKPRPGDHWWNVLYGLVGYRRQGAYGQTQLFYVPFQTDGPD